MENDRLYPFPQRHDQLGDSPRVTTMNRILAMVSLAIAAATPELSTADVESWGKIEAQLESQKAVWSAPPVNVVTEYMTHAPVLGNGTIAVALGGDEALYQLHVAHDELWVNSPVEPKRWIVARAVPVGEILIRPKRISADNGTSYSAELDYSKGEIRAVLPFGRSPISIRTWLTQSDVVVIEMTSEASTGFDIDVTLKARTSDPINRPFNAGMVEGIPWVARGNRPGEALPFNSRVAMGAILPGKTAPAESDRISRSGLTFRLEPGASETLAVKVAGGIEKPDPVAALSSELTELSQEQLAKDYREHLHWLKRHYLNSYVLTDDPLLNDFYFAELFSLAVNNGDGSGRLPPMLYGNFFFSEFMRWSGYTLNYNHYAPLWGVYSSNREELAEAHYRVLLDQVPRGRDIAREQGFKKGVLFEVHIAPFGGVVEPVLHDMHSNAVFSAQNFITHYEYTRDLSFWTRTDLASDGQTTPYDFLIAVADFWEEKFSNGKDSEGPYKGQFVVRNSAASELSFPTDINPITDVGMVRRLFNSLLMISTALDVDEHRRDTWREIAAHMGAFPTTPCPTIEGQCFKKAANRKEVAKRLGASFNQMGSPVFPLEFTSLTDLRPEGEILRKTMINTLMESGSWGQPNSFSSIFTVAVRAGYDPEKLLNLFRAELNKNKLPNGQYATWRHGYETAGALETINSMMIQSQHDFIWLFPAWPRGKVAEFKDLRAKGGFVLSSSVDSDGYVGTTLVKSERGGLLRIRDPWNRGAIVVTADGLPVDYDTIGNDLISWATSAGEQYTLFRPQQGTTPERE